MKSRERDEKPRPGSACGSSGCGEKASDVAFRVTEASDLPWVMHLEQRPDVAPFIVPWSFEQHEMARRSTDWAHLILGQPGVEASLGFALISGCQTAELCLHRLVVSRQGEGLGRAALRQLKALAFGTWGARRLWLDVFDFNERALALYRSEGFRRIGSRPGIDSGGSPGSTLCIMEVTPEPTADGRV